MWRKWILSSCIVLAGVAAMGSVARAQQGSACQTAEVTDPPRIVLSCANGLVIEAEAPTQKASTFLFPTLQISPVSVDVTDRGVLISLTPNTGPFQIMTPHAIVSARGTVFVVDVSAEATAVFVVEGVVEVSRPDGVDKVELGAGDGVTVSANSIMTVKQWPNTKVSALLARFAR